MSEIVELLMVLVTAVALAAMATFVLPSVPRVARIVTLTTLAVILMAVHWTIYEVDHQYDGIVQVEPVQLALVSDTIATEFTERHPDVALPCDELGRPI